MIPLNPIQTSQAHAPTHATGGTDPLTPEAIGAASEFYAENLAQDATNAAFAHTNSAIASHLAATNPHGITPSAIGAAAASHTHTGAQISGNIAGSAGNITGIAAIANGGTNATDAAAARTNLGITPANIGAAAATHTHTGAQITGTLAIANGGTNATDATTARTNLGAAAASHTHNLGITKHTVPTDCSSSASISINVAANFGYKFIVFFSHNGRISGETGFSCAREFIAAFSPSMGMEIYDLYNLGSATGGYIEIALNKVTMIATITKTAGNAGTYDGTFSVFVIT